MDFKNRWSALMRGLCFLECDNKKMCDKEKWAIIIIISGKL